MKGYMVQIFDAKGKDITIDFDYRPVFVSRPKAVRYCSDKLTLFKAEKYKLTEVEIIGLGDTPEFLLAEAIMGIVESRQG